MIQLRIVEGTTASLDFGRFLASFRHPEPYLPWNSFESTSGYTPPPHSVHGAHIILVSDIFWFDFKRALASWKRFFFRMKSSVRSSYPVEAISILEMIVQTENWTSSPLGSTGSEKLIWQTISTATAINVAQQPLGFLPYIKKAATKRTESSRKFQQ